jgi:quinolinate synthase
MTPSGLSESGVADNRLSARLAHVSAAAELEPSLPVIEEILELKERVGAAVIAHSYHVPLITSTVADFTGDSLALAQFAARAEADTIVVCGVRFMAETVKLLCPEKRVLLSAAAAGCPLADSIVADDVLRIRAHCPGVPVIACLNTSAAVKAEADICCTPANAVRIASSLSSDKVILLPDRHLADYVAQTAAIEVIAWKGECEVRPCNLCPGMRTTTLETIAAALRGMRAEIWIDAAIAERARRSLARMMATA